MITHILFTDFSSCHSPSCPCHACKDHISIKSLALESCQLLMEPKLRQLKVQLKIPGKFLITAGSRASHNAMGTQFQASFAGSCCSLVVGRGLLAALLHILASYISTTFPVVPYKVLGCGLGSCTHPWNNHCGQRDDMLIQQGVQGRISFIQNQTWGWRR